MHTICLCGSFDRGNDEINNEIYLLKSCCVGNMWCAASPSTNQADICKMLHKNSDMIVYDRCCAGWTDQSWDITRQWLHQWNKYEQISLTKDWILVALQYFKEKSLISVISSKRLSSALIKGRESFLINTFYTLIYCSLGWLALRHLSCCCCRFPPLCWCCGHLSKSACEMTGETCE